MVAAGANGPVLVVEDDDGLREHIVLLLEQSGYAVA
jgi:DNA-binding response OmpR family regulator